MRDRCQDSGPPRLNHNIFDNGCCLATRKFKRNRAPRGFTDNAERVKNRIGIYLNDNAVNEEEEEKEKKKKKKKKKKHKKTPPHKKRRAFSFPKKTRPKTEGARERML